MIYSETITIEIPLEVSYELADGQILLLTAKVQRPGALPGNVVYHLDGSWHVAKSQEFVGVDVLDFLNQASIRKIVETIEYSLGEP